MAQNGPCTPACCMPVVGQPELVKGSKYYVINMMDYAYDMIVLLVPQVFILCSTCRTETHESSVTWRAACSLHDPCTALVVVANFCRASMILFTARLHLRWLHSCEFLLWLGVMVPLHVLSNFLVGC